MLPPVQLKSTTSPLSPNNPFHPDNVARRKASSSSTGPSNPVNPAMSGESIRFQTEQTRSQAGIEFGPTIINRGKGKTEITISNQEAGTYIDSHPEITAYGNIRTEGLTNISLATNKATGDIHFDNQRKIQDKSTYDVSGDLVYSGEKNVAGGAIKGKATEASVKATAATEAVSNDRGLNTKFNVALTFAGEIRDKIESLLPHLDTAFGKDNYFYDNRYTDILSQPHLDSLLQDVYKNADLVVVVLSENYTNRFWCNKVEYPEVQKHIQNRLGKKIMYVRTDDTVNLPEGMTGRDGYIDLRNRTPETIVAEIKRRFDRLRPDWHGQ